MKWLTILVLAALLGGAWFLFAKQGDEIKRLQTEIVKVEDKGDPYEKTGKMKDQVVSLEGQRTIIGILLTFLSAGIVGIFFVVYLLPFFAQRVTHAVYDSSEMIEEDVMHTARSLMAQGEYEGAIEAFREAAAADPLNRLPYVEIAKIQKDNLHDPQAAIQTIRHALESQEWEINDAAYFLFRLAELYNDVEGNRSSAIAIMNQVVEQFPGTRHSANAAHKLHEWSVEDNTNAAAGEEAEYLARQAAAEEEEDPQS